MRPNSNSRLKKFIGTIFGVFSVFGIPFHAEATPSRVVIVRHGEKIDDLHSDLSPQGCERAYQLPLFFEAYRSTAVAIYAQQPKKVGGSIRPIETMAPTAEKFGLRINNRFLRDDVTSVASEILNSPAYDGKTVFVSWEHSAILSLVPALGLKIPVNLQVWPSGVFDQAWVISFTGKASSLEIVAEYVLPTDIENRVSGVSNWPNEIAPTDNGIVVPPGVVSECASGNRRLDRIAAKAALYQIPGL